MIQQPRMNKPELANGSTLAFKSQYIRESTITDKSSNKSNKIFR